MAKETECWLVSLRFEDEDGRSDRFRILSSASSLLELQDEIRHRVACECDSPQPIGGNDRVIERIDRVAVRSLAEDRT